MSLRMYVINLLGLYLIIFEDNNGCCLDTVWELPRPSISHLQAVGDKQSLLVSWLVNHSGFVGGIYEIQIGRTEHCTVIYSTNVSLFPVDAEEYTWTWTSDLPLECVDHSVRIRHFSDNQSVPSLWSNWITNHGAQAKDTTRIFPFQGVLREGTSAMFCCVPPKGVHVTSIAFDNKKFPLISIGATVKAINVNYLTVPTTLIKAHLLSCTDATGKISSTLNYVSFPPHKPRNLSCASSDLTSVTCTWDRGKEAHLPSHSKQTHTLHIENSDQTPIICERSSCTFRAVPQLEEYKIRVVVKDRLGEEAESYSFNISERVLPVVELDRVSPGVTDTTVSWMVQGNLTQAHLLCQVTTDPGSTTLLIGRSVSGLRKVKLEHLLPNTLYSTRVRCSANGRLWGQWTQPVSFITYPLVTLDVWRIIKQLPDPNSRQVTLLWTPHIPGSATTVNIQGYIVEWSLQGQNWTEWKNSGQTQAHDVSIGPGQYDFTVKAVVHTDSTIPAHITIPQKDNEEPLPVEKRLSSGTSAGFNLSWDKQDTATCGYTVEWCIVGNVVPCTLRWIKVQEGNNTLFIPDGNSKAGFRYTFNIYGCTESGHRLLEIQTGYSQELKSVQCPSVVEPVQRTSSSVTLQWRYSEDDAAHPAFISGYLVTIQEVGSDRMPDHVANMFNMTVADPRRKSVTIAALKQNQEYTLSVSALTKEGPGQPATITIRTTTNYSVHLAKTLTPVLLLLGCTILLWPQIKMLKSGLKDIFVYPAGMNVQTPELDCFLHETCERLQSQKVEECSSCDIEILNTPSLSCVLPLQADYCPQSVAVLLDRPALKQITCMTNTTYFNTLEEDFSEERVAFTETNELSETLLESCSVTYSYISKDTL